MKDLRLTLLKYFFFSLASSLLFTCPARAASPTLTQVISLSSGQCLRPSNGSTGAGAAIVQSPCTSDASMFWSVAQVGTGFQVVSQSTGLCLGVSGASTQAGAALIQWPCQGLGVASGDKWSIKPVSSGQGSYFTMASLNSGMCVAVSGASTATEVPMVQWPCQSSDGWSNQFYLNAAAVPNQSPATTTGSTIVAASSGQCLQAADSSTTNGITVVQSVCAGSVPQAWSLAAVGSYFHVISQNSGLCLNVQYNSYQAGMQLIQWPCQNNGQTNDQWSLNRVQSAAGTFYTMVARSSGMCAAVAGGSTAPGTSLIQWPCQSAAALTNQFAIGPASSANGTLPSSWTATIPLPINAVAAANLPNGNLLLWSTVNQFSYEGDIGSNNGQTYWDTFNPNTLVATQALTNSAGADLFCPGTAMLANGNILVNGGSSSPKTTIFDVTKGQWQSDANMTVPRGYESDTLLSNRSVFTFGGSWSGGVSAKNGEVWTNGQGWYNLTNAPDNQAIGPDPAGDYRGDNHMWLFAQSNGMVFQAGPSAQMNWISTSGSGSITSAGNRGSDPYSINGNAVLYDVGRILKVGGASSYDQHGNTPIYATNSAFDIDISAGPSAPVKLNQLSPMLYARAFANAVLLPSGDVVIVGGQSIPNPFTDTAAVLTPELWDHTTKTFTALNPMQTPRTYHSTAMLLADGRVFVGGGGQCGPGCADNHLNAEILTPPYLLNADGSAAARPAIATAPAQANLGSTVTVTTDSTVSAFSLIRLSATTHTVNNDQRRIPLTAMPQAGKSNTYSLAIPSDPGVVLPGYYMLFALNANGVPSIAVTLQVP